MLFQSPQDVLLLFPPLGGLLFEESDSDFSVEFVDIHGLQPLFDPLVVLLKFVDNFPMVAAFVVVTTLECRLDPV